MSKIISAGVLLECKGKFLIGHPTELTGTTHGWGILKGRQDKEDTDLFETAFREFKEESGIDLSGSTLFLNYFNRPFFKYTVGNKKDVFVFWVIDTFGELEHAKFTCPSLVPNSDKPEIDDYKWVTADEAIELVTESQKDLFRKVKELTQHK